ncbi:hypothetical protein LOD99_1912 [Oopsacas minuta]|uniref:Uncharacterized protein n=1 Tax=Oopsacas minuta TaxID=111878 RepID=A0AAV7K3V6_9METZ|nr:hypothetical protein LOD99_1912 [Oopsacas minuta]
MTELNESIDTELNEFIEPIKNAFKEIRERLDKEEANLLNLYSGLRKRIYKQTSKKASKIEELNLTKLEIESSLIHPDLDALKLELIDNIERELEYLASEEEEDTLIDDQEALSLITEGIQSFQNNLKSTQNEINLIVADKLISDKHDSVAKQSEKLIPNFVKTLSKPRNKTMSKEDATKLYPTEILPKKSFAYKGNKSGELNGPLGITIDRKQLVYVADCYNSRIQVFNIEGEYISEFGRKELHRPYCVGIYEHSIFVSDSGKGVIFKYEHPKYEFIGQSPEGELRDPNGITVSKGCNLYIADSKNNRIAVYDSKLHYTREIGRGALHKPSDVKLRFHQLYVVDNGKPYNVHVFSKIGEHIKSLISLEGEPFWNFLCFDRFDNILISDNSGKALYVYTKEGVLVNKTAYKYGPTGVAVTRDNTVVWVNVNESAVNIFHT